MSIKHRPHWNYHLIHDSLNEDLAESAVHIGRLQRLRASQQDALDERESLDTLMKTEVVADDKTAWAMAYIIRSWHNHWVLLEQLISEGECDIVLSLTALSWLSEKEFLRLEALVDDAEWTASPHVRVAALPELPLGLIHFSHSWM